MQSRNLLKRIERAEKALKAQGHFSSECICFPENEPIGFSWPLEQQIAFALKCPLHGDRFGPMGLLYVSEWLRDKQQYFLAKRKSAQYRKAWAATFPLDLWPGEEEKADDGKIFLKLILAGTRENRGRAGARIVTSPRPEDFRLFFTLRCIKLTFPIHD